MSDDPAPITNMLCLAVRGSIGRFKMWVRMRSFEHWANNNNWWENWYEFENDQTQYTSPGDGREWGYQCFDIFMIFDTENQKHDWQIDYDQAVTIKHVQVKESGSTDYTAFPHLKNLAVDNLIIGNSMMGALVQRTALPGNLIFFSLSGNF